MEPAHYNNVLTAETGRQGGLKRAERQSAEERIALARHAARSRWHPQEVQAAKEKAQEQAYLIQQILKNGKQLPLV